MKKDSTGVKLGIAFGVLISLLVGVGWLGLSRMDQMNSDVSNLFNRRWEKVQLARRVVYYAISNYRITTKIAVMKSGVKTPADLFPVERAENRLNASEAEKKLAAMINSEAEKVLLGKVDEARERVHASQETLFGQLLSRKKSDQISEVVLDETFSALDNYRDTLTAFVQLEENQLNEAREQSEASYEAARQISALLIIMTIAVAIGIAMFVTRKLTAETQQREHAQTALRKLNEDLEKKVAERTEELARTVEALKGEVSDRKVREEENRRLAAIVEHSDDAIIALDLDGRITDWNAGAERMLGYTRKEIIGMPITTVVPADHHSEPFENQAKLKRGDTVVRRDSLRKRKDGMVIHVALTVSPIRDKDGAIIGS